jgi:hypothetical protein
VCPCSLKESSVLVVNGETLYFSFCVRCPSNVFKPAGDRLSNLVGTVLLHEVENPDDDAVLIKGTREIRVILYAKEPSYGSSAETRGEGICVWIA